MEVDVHDARDKTLLLHELVEVFEPSAGFWHSGKVVDVKPGQRTVEYAQGQEEIMLESFPIEKMDSGKRLRPRPPVCASICRQNWQKGLWVDAFRDASWREGVLAEVPDAKTAVVYFPGLADKQVFSLDKVRVSQVWNDQTNAWSVKGYQPVLEWQFDRLENKQAKPQLTYQRKRKRNSSASPAEVDASDDSLEKLKRVKKENVETPPPPVVKPVVMPTPVVKPVVMPAVKQEQLEKPPENPVKQEQPELPKPEPLNYVDVRHVETLYSPGMRGGINGYAQRLDTKAPVKVEIAPTMPTIPVCHMNTQSEDVMFIGERGAGLGISGQQSSAAYLNSGDMRKNAFFNSKKKKKSISDVNARARDEALKQMAIKNLEASGWKRGIRERQREKNRVSKEAYYIDPDGKSYHSLTSACGAWMLQNSHVDKETRDAMKSYQMQIVFRRRYGSQDKPEDGDEVTDDTTPKKRKLRPNRKYEPMINDEEIFRETPKKGRPRLTALLSRSTQKGENSEKNVKKATIPSWLIDLGIITENELVSYLNKDTQVVWRGKLTRDGVVCQCCNTVFTIPKFQVHAGNQVYRTSAQMFLNDGRSIMDCQKRALKMEQDKAAERAAKEPIILDESDECCGLCGEGGILILCEHCPATFHLDCVFLKTLPEGDWFCPKCRCPVCGVSQFDGRDVRKCNQCERSYHVECVNAGGFSQCRKWFCSQRCHNIFGGLRSIIGIPNPMPEGYTWTLLRSSEQDEDVQEADPETVAEHSSKLALALSVMQECFSPMIDPRRKIDVIAHILKNCSCDLRRLDFRGFYTLLLEKDEIISVATIRVHGAHIAEMPLIGTRLQYRRQGMCRQLMDVIEQVLRSLEIDTLILPAVPELLDTWIGAFGFVRSMPSHTLRLLELNIVAFPGTKVLYKPLTWLNLCRKIAPPVAEKPWIPGTMLNMGIEEARPSRRPKSQKHFVPAHSAATVPHQQAIPATDAVHDDSTEDSKLVVAKTRSNRVVKPSARVTEALEFRKSLEQPLTNNNCNESPELLKLGPYQSAVIKTDKEVLEGGSGVSEAVTGLGEGVRDGVKVKQCEHCGTTETPMWRKVSEVPAAEVPAVAFPSSFKTL